MILDNRNIVLILNIRRYLALLVFLVLMGLILLVDIIEKPFLGMSKSFYVLIICALYVVYVIISYMRDYKFFSYNDESEKLIFRFVSLRPFDNKKQAIEIQKKYFNGYKINKSVFNFKEDLILIVKTKSGVANYPPISITALSLKQKNLLKNSLNQLA